MRSGAPCNARAVDQIIKSSVQQALLQRSSSFAANVTTLDSRGLKNLRLSRLDVAIADFDVALAIDPKFASSL